MATFTYDVNTACGMVRLLVADTDRDDHDFSDEEIAVALELGHDNVRRAGAWLLMALANNRARLAVRLQRGGVSEDLTGLAAALRAQAQALVAEADAEAKATPLEAVISPTVDRFSAARNYRLGRSGLVTQSP